MIMSTRIIVHASRRRTGLRADELQALLERLGVVIHRLDDGRWNEKGLASAPCSAPAPTACMCNAYMCVCVRVCVCGHPYMHMLSHTHMSPHPTVKHMPPPRPEWVINDQL